MVFRQSRLLSGVALAIFVTTFGLPFVTPQHHWGDDVDTGWGDLRIVQGHPVTQVEQVYPSPREQHCAICHLARAFRSSIPSAPAVQRPAAATTRLIPSEDEFGSNVPVSASAPRGPPPTL